MNARVSMGAALVLCAAAASVTGCSASPESSQGEPGSGASSHGGAAGSVGLDLNLPSGQSIEVLSWSISGPDGAATVVQSGSVKSQSAGFSVLVGGIPAGSGYRVTVSGTAIDGSVTCTGAASFDIAPRTTTPVSLLLACSVDTGGAHVTRINGTSFNCAGTNGFSANPSETTVGHSVALHATAGAPEPGSLTYQWSAPSGTFDQPTSASTNFTCTSVGHYTVTLQVADGPVPSGQSCSSSIDTASAVITCDEPVTPPPDGGTDGGTSPDGGTPVPALPPAGVAGLGAALAALGARVTRRRRHERS